MKYDFDDGFEDDGSYDWLEVDLMNLSTSVRGVMEENGWGEGQGMEWDVRAVKNPDGSISSIQIEVWPSSSAWR